MAERRNGILLALVVAAGVAVPLSLLTPHVTYWIKTPLMVLLGLCIGALVAMSRR